MSDDLSAQQPLASARNDRRAWRIFAAGMALYLATRLIALPNFPIYFFSDEAIQTLSAADLIQNSFRGPAGNLLPLFFENGGQYNLSISVYLQLLVAWLPRSIWLTRGLPALVSLVVPLCLGLALKEFFNIRYWWLAPWLLAALPAWFLHSRTAFETALAVSFYAVFLYFYLRYRLKNRRSLPLALLFGALAFYTYSPMELVVVMTGLVLLIVDWRYHWQDKRATLGAAVWLMLLALPYLNFRVTHSQSITQHLSLLQSYWLEPLPLHQKLGMYFSRYLKGLNPFYWFFYNQTDLIRHQMKGMGHLPLFSLPLILLGLALAVKNHRQPAWRVVIVALLCAPCGAALVDVQITRVLVMVVPAALLACLGLDHALVWAESTVFHLRRWPAAAAVTFLGVFSLGMTAWALAGAPLWYPDYGLYGMQWGAREVFTDIQDFQKQNPQARIILSPTWANASDVLARYFLGDPLPIEMGTVEMFTQYQQTLDEHIVLVMPPNELEWAAASGLFTPPRVLRVLNWPDGRPGFYYVNLQYVDDVDALFAKEYARRSQPLTSSVEWLGQQVIVRYPLLDLGSVEAAFDGDTTSLLRTFEANPLVLELTFAEPVSVSELSVWLGNSPTMVQISLVSAENGEVLELSARDDGQDIVHPLTLRLEAALRIRQITLSLTSLAEGFPAHVHLWEVALR